MIYNRAVSGGSAFDGWDVLPGRRLMSWNGALRFVVRANAYAADYDEDGNQVRRVLASASGR